MLLTFVLSGPVKKVSPMLLGSLKSATDIGLITASSVVTLAAASNVGMKVIDRWRSPKVPLGFAELAPANDLQLVLRNVAAIESELRAELSPFQLDVDNARLFEFEFEFELSGTPTLGEFLIAAEKFGVASRAIVALASMAHSGRPTLEDRYFPTTDSLLRYLAQHSYEWDLQITGLEYGSAKLKARFTRGAAATAVTLIAALSQISGLQVTTFLNGPNPAQRSQVSCIDRSSEGVVTVPAGYQFNATLPDGRQLVASCDPSNR